MSVWFSTEMLLFTARARSWAFPEFIQGPRGYGDKGETLLPLTASPCCPTGKPIACKNLPEEGN